MALANDQLYTAAQRRADELEAVLDVVDVGISMIATDGRMLVRNPAAIEITGRREYTGKLSESGERHVLRDAVTGEHVPLEESPLGRALRGERVRDVLLMMRDTQGRDRLTQASSVPVRDASGQVVAAVTVFRELQTKVIDLTPCPPSRVQEGGTQALRQPASPSSSGHALRGQGALGGSEESKWKG
jgi:PAS domain-containing protein